MTDGTGYSLRKRETPLHKARALGELPLVTALLIITVLVALLAAGGSVLDLIREVQGVRTG